MANKRKRRHHGNKAYRKIQRERLERLLIRKKNEKKQN